MNIISFENGNKLNIDKKETYRYLGYHFGGEVPVDDELEKMVNELTKKLQEVITPRCIYEIYRLRVEDGFCKLNVLDLGNNSFTTDSGNHVSDPMDEPVLVIESKKLSAHIKECRYAILFAATIGPGADMLIRRFSGRSTVKPAILQAAGAAAIEAFADEATDMIKRELEGYKYGKALQPRGENVTGADSVSFRMRFSPGYGDFSLEHQNDFFRLLQLEKNLGMSLNSALLMSPSKSITAVIGVL